MSTCPECDGEMQPQTFRSKTGRVILSDERRCSSCGHEVITEVERP